MTPLPIPERWMTGQIKNVADISLGKMLQPNDSGGDVLMNYMRAANVQPDGILRLDPKQMWFRPNEIDGLALRRGDVVVVEGGVGGYGRAAYLSHDLDGWGFQNSINRLRLTAYNDGRFLTYYLIALRKAGFIERYCNVVSMPHLTAEKLAAVPVPIPAPDEQRAIADFLDRETSRIDSLIQEQQRLIDLLQERRAAAIARATGWDGEDHPGWVSRRLSWLFGSTASGTTPANEDIVYSTDAEVPWVTTSELREALINGTLRGVTKETMNRYSALRLHPAGSLLIAMYGATIGRLAILGVDATSNQACCALVNPVGTSAEFVQYSLSAAKPRLLLEAAGGGQPNINQDKIRSFRIPVPPVDVQNRIVDYLNVTIKKINALIAAAEKFVDLSQERRSALITAAVTGQIDVRDEVA